jgi:plasmid stabilization system protein ParE
VKPTDTRAFGGDGGFHPPYACGHVVFFREDPAAVTVVRVLHQSMDVG